MKEVHILTIDDRIIEVYAHKYRADEEWKVLTRTTKIVDQLNEHAIYVKTMEVIE